MPLAPDKNIDTRNSDLTTPSTRDRLVEAALTEFNDKGFAGTDTNRIARAAGFAPQTFYRHFKDKTEIFLAAHDQCMRSEYRAIDRVAMGVGFDLAIADIIIAHHQAWRRFYAGMKVLADSNDRVRAKRIESQAWKLARVKKLPGNEDRSDAALLADLFAIERLCDAVVEGEFASAGVDPEAARALVGDAVARVCGMKR